MCLRVVILFTSISGAPGQMEYRGYLGAAAVFWDTAIPYYNTTQLQHSNTFM